LCRPRGCPPVEGRGVAGVSDPRISGGGSTLPRPRGVAHARADSVVAGRKYVMRDAAKGVVVTPAEHAAVPPAWRVASRLPNVLVAGVSRDA